MGVRDQTGPALSKQLEVFAEAHPEVPHEFWQAQYTRHVEARLMMNELAALVEKRFSPEEIEVLLEFYQSPVGKHVIELRVEMAREARALGKKLGELFQRDVRYEMRKAGYLK